MIARMKIDPRDISIEKAVHDFVKKHEGKCDFYDVVTQMPLDPTIKVENLTEGEAKASLVHMINEQELDERPGGKIWLPKMDPAHNR